MGVIFINADVSYYIVREKLMCNQFKLTIQTENYKLPNS